MLLANPLTVAAMTSTLRLPSSRPAIRSHKRSLLRCRKVLRRMCRVSISSVAVALCKRRSILPLARLASLMASSLRLSLFRSLTPSLSCKRWTRRLALPLLLLLLCGRSAEAQNVASPDTPLSVLVCVPDSSGALQASQAPCPSSPISYLEVVPNAVVLSQQDYQNLLTYDGPLSVDEGQSLALTCAGTVVALYLVALGVGVVVRLIKTASS